MDDLLTVKQLARILKVHELTIRRYILEGKIKAQKIGGNVRIPKDEITKLSLDYSPQPRPKRKFINSTALTFQPNDPIFRLKGRGIRVEQKS